MSDRWIPETLSQAQAGLRDPRLEVPATRSLHSGGGGRRLRSEHTAFRRMPERHRDSSEGRRSVVAT